MHNRNISTNFQNTIIHFHAICIVHSVYCSFKRHLLAAYLKNRKPTEMGFVEWFCPHLVSIINTLREYINGLWVPLLNTNKYFFFFSEFVMLAFMENNISNHSKIFQLIFINWRQKLKTTKIFMIYTIVRILLHTIYYGWNIDRNFCSHCTSTNTNLKLMENKFSYDKPNDMHIITECIISTRQL